MVLNEQLKTYENTLGIVTTTPRFICQMEYFTNPCDLFHMFLQGKSQKKMFGGS